MTRWWWKRIGNIGGVIWYIIDFMLVLVGKIKYRLITSKKKAFALELFGSSKLYKFTGLQVRACKKMGNLKLYSDNP